MIINHPGPWQQYHLRSDNRGLSTIELKSKYINEQYLFEAQMTQLQHQHNIFMNGGGGGPLSPPPLPSIDPDAQAFITAAGITNPTQQSAIEALVLSLKGNSIWDKFAAIYPFVGGTAFSHKFNLKDPRDLDAAYRLSFNGGITHSSNGALPNGTTGYANTFFNPTTPPNDGVHFSNYYRTNAIDVKFQFGCVYTIDAGENRQFFNHYLQTTPTNTSYANGGDSSTNIPTPNNLGNHIVTRINGSTIVKLFKNGTLLSSIDTFGGANANANMFLMGNNTVQRDDSPPQQTFYGTVQIAFATIGAGLTDTEAVNLNTAIATFQTTLGRQV